MDKTKLLEIEAAVRPFRAGYLQDYLTLHAHLQQRGITAAMLRAYLKQRIATLRRSDQRSAARIRAANRAARIWREKAPRCESCGGQLKLSPGDDADSHWWCPACRWGRYDPRPVDKILADLGIAPQPQPPSRNPGGYHG